ncbi:hypothetical protein PBRA_009046 [Plasmodiophora brassicae]|uniref:LMBR1-like membrane protein n=1 Tax=Plasmodiophora brassicae TaxID=37360 RepID=A0A0G4J4M5_PLABS|nr:hypothetical protein PBRA_009046 [Plasmodiophora brassicae]
MFTWLQVWLACTVAASAVVSGALLYQLAHPDVRLPCKVTVFFAWALAFTVIWVTPLDLDADHAASALLFPVWNATYWCVSLLTWLLIPLQQAYYDSGHFTVRDKLKDAFRANVRFYVVALVLISVVGVTAAATSGLRPDELVGLGMALANVWGMLLMVLLLGTFGDRRRIGRALYFNAVAVHDEYQDSLEKLSDSMTMVVETSLRVKQMDDPLLAHYMEIIEGECPAPGTLELTQEYAPSSLAAELRGSDLNEPILARLHSRVKADHHESRRAQYQWHLLLDKVDEFEREEDESARRNVFHQTLYRTVNLHVAARVLSVVCAIMTLAVIWSEVTLSIGVRLSIFYNIVNSVSDPALVYLTGAVVSSYLAVCAFYSMFRLRLSSFYHLHFGRHSEANSLLFNASYILRLVFPIGVNVFSMTKDDRGQTTAFESVLGVMNVVPLLGEKFNLFVPIVISVFCFITLANFYGRILRCLQLGQFEENGPGSDEVVQEGKSLVKRTQRKRKRGAAAGLYNQKPRNGGYQQLGPEVDSPSQ